MALSTLVLAVGGADAETVAAWRSLPCFGAASAPLLEATLAILARPDAGPLTSSAGRLFDAAASILGLRQRMSYEGQAASELEDAAAESGTAEAYPFGWIEPRADSGRPDGDETSVVDTAPLFRALLADAREGRVVADCARRVHNARVGVVREAAARARTRRGLDLVVLSGGVMQNRLLVESCVTALEGDGVTVLTQAQVSPNDEGVALGQAWGGLLSLLG
jgi:hydrogenase maturation protein HypF